jgi:formylglycine-generating enzyme required for sulfatase activity
VTGGVEHLDLEGAAMSNTRYNDRKIVSSAVGQYLANDFGLFDMHGNVAEWTRSVYQAYPYNEYDGRNNPAFKGEKTVRGGSWFDRPERCRSAFRLSYPAWQKVFNVGFRVVQEINSEIKHALYE